MGECNGCGRCCDPVVLPYSLNELRRALPGMIGMDPRDHRFALSGALTPVQRREGLARADYLSAGVTVLGAPGSRGATMLAWSQFYDCAFFDRATRRCTNYNDRPPMCADYPWYGDPPDTSKAIPPECSYRDDLPVTFRGRKQT